MRFFSREGFKRILKEAPIDDGGFSFSKGAPPWAQVLTFIVLCAVGRRRSTDLSRSERYLLKESTCFWAWIEFFCCFPEAPFQMMHLCNFLPSRVPLPHSFIGISRCRKQLFFTRGWTFFPYKERTGFQIVLFCWTRIVRTQHPSQGFERCVSCTFSPLKCWD